MDIRCPPNTLQIFSSLFYEVKKKIGTKDYYLKNQIPNVSNQIVALNPSH
jgi:hypothetical protein